MRRWGVVRLWSSPAPSKLNNIFRNSFYDCAVYTANSPEVLGSEVSGSKMLKTHQALPPYGCHRHQRLRQPDLLYP